MLYAFIWLYIGPAVEKKTFSQIIKLETKWIFFTAKIKNKKAREPKPWCNSFVLKLKPRQFFFSNAKKQVYSIKVPEFFN